MAENQPDNVGRVHMWVSGRVQGVGFRAYVLRNGTLLGLAGWVRNQGYDQVETVAEGPRPSLERFIEMVRNGPPASRVDSDHVDWEIPLEGFSRFVVK